MPMTPTIDPDQRLVTILFTADPSFDEWKATMEAIFAHPDYRPGFNFLGDRRAVRTPPERSYFERTVEFTNAHADQVRGARWATLVATPAGYGMARVAQVLADEGPIEVGVFTELSAAMGWLRGEA
jgi:hypothetical protein